MSFVEFMQEEPLILISLLVPMVPILIALLIVVRVTMRNMLKQRRTIAVALVPTADKADLLDVSAMEDLPAELISEDDEVDSEDLVPDENASPMDSLLKSVFQEELDTDHYDVLLNDIDPVDIDDLVEAVQVMHRRLINKGSS